MSGSTERHMVLFSMFWSVAAFAAVTPYPPYPGAKPSPAYNVTVDGQPVFVHRFLTYDQFQWMDYASFSMTGKVRVAVTNLVGEMNVLTCDVRPLAYGIKPQISGNFVFENCTFYHPTRPSLLAGKNVSPVLFKNVKIGGVTIRNADQLRRAGFDVSVPVKFEPWRRAQGVPPGLSSHAVLIGTLGHSAIIDALVIAGSDRRGTAFGAYDLSRQIGVSLWYWWADVPPQHRDALLIRAGRYRQGPPSVKYRGIFIRVRDLLPRVLLGRSARLSVARFDATFPDLGGDEQGVRLPDALAVGAQCRRYQAGGVGDRVLHDDGLGHVEVQGREPASVPDGLGDSRIRRLERRGHRRRDDRVLSPVGYGDEARERLDRYAALARAADLMNQKMLYADRSFLYAAQGRASANDYANRVRAAFARIEAETEYFNTVVAGGKWNYMMSSNPRSRAVFDLPATAAVTPVAGIGWGVAVEGGVSSDTLPTFDATTTPSLDDPTKGPSLEYDFYVFHPGKTRVLVTALPTQRIHAGRHLRYAVAIDDSSPAVVNLEDAGRWEENVLRAAVTGASDGAVGKPGKHTLKIWMMDPGVVLDKIVLDFGGLKPSYLGPPATRIAG